MAGFIDSSKHSKLWSARQKGDDSSSQWKECTTAKPRPRIDWRAGLTFWHSLIRSGFKLSIAGMRPPAPFFFVFCESNCQQRCLYTKFALFLNHPGGVANATNVSDNDERLVGQLLKETLPWFYVRC